MLAFIWFSAFFAPEHTTGFHPGEKFIVVKGFSSGDFKIDEGVILEFKGERKYTADEFDATPEHDIYDFLNLDINQEIVISSLEFGVPLEIMKYLKKVE